MDRNVSRFIGRIDLVAVLVVKTGGKDQWNKGLGHITSEPALLPKLERIVLVQWKIRLLINLTEADHQELYRTIEKAFQRDQSEDLHEAEVEAEMENITRLGLATLKREWMRVKKGI